MKTNTLTGIEVFDEGFHNNITFDSSDLDGIVSSFNALDLSGRIPIVYGHSSPDVRTDDSAPALGWVTKLYKRGTKLLADISDVAPEVLAKIKSGAFRFCSIELLRGVKAGTRVIPFVLDRIALLGATPPALGHLAPLKASRLPLEFDEIVSFNRQESNTDMTDTTTTEQFAALTKRHVALLFETAIKDGRCLPRDREMFNRRFPDSSAADAESFIQQTPRPPSSTDRRRVVTMGGLDQDRVSLSSRPDHQVMEKVTAYFDEQRTKGKALPEGDFASILKAAKEVFRRNPDLAQAWKDAPGES